VRLPNGVFNPYTGIKTNILFFTKGTPTTDIWFYEHPYPEGVKNYNKTKPMQFEEFAAEIAWWGDESDGFAARVENEQAWKVDFAAKKAQARLDAKPHWDKAIELKQTIEQLKQQLLESKVRLKLAKEQKADTKALEKAVKDLGKQINNRQAQARASQKAGDDVYYAVFNFDIKNPFLADVVVHDPETLLSAYQAQQEEIQGLRDQLKGILAGALAGDVKA
jgi:type I restriction enzyme M protein